MKRILIDGRFVGVGESMSRYTLELLSHILEIDKENEYSLLIRPAGVAVCAEFFSIEKLGIEELIRNSKLEIRNLHIVVLDIPHYSISEQIGLLTYLNKENYDLVHFPQFNHPIRYRGKYVVTIHDLILLDHAKGNPIKRLALLPVIKSAARDSAAIITASTLVKNEIIRTFKVDGDKISLIYHGLDHNRFNISAKSEKELLEKFLSKNKIEQDYLLYVGAWKSHKNVIRMIESYEKYLEKNGRFVHLVLVGKIDSKEKKLLAKIEATNNRTIEQYNSAGIIIAGPTADDRELAAIYGGSLAYVMPSLAEGFGWPPLEAMACGTPVISSNYSCMPEILGEAALYFDPMNIDEMSDAIAKIINDHTLRQDLIRKGLEQVKKYNWSETAERTMKIYKEILTKD